MPVQSRTSRLMCRAALSTALAVAALMMVPLTSTANGIISDRYIVSAGPGGVVSHTGELIFPPGFVVCDVTFVEGSDEESLCFLGQGIGIPPGESPHPVFLVEPVGSMNEPAGSVSDVVSFVLAADPTIIQAISYRSDSLLTILTPPLGGSPILETGDLQDVTAAMGLTFSGLKIEVQSDLLDAPGTAIPEPSPVLLLLVGTGLLGVGQFARLTALLKASASRGLRAESVPRASA